MNTIQFKQMRDIAGNTSSDHVEFRDETGQIWYVPEGHRIWTDIYEPWLATGNTPLGPDDPWPTT